MYKIIVLFIILVPIRLYAVDCDGDWRKKVTKKNFHEYEKCMTEAEQKEGKLFTTDMNEISSIGYATTNFREKCTPIEKFFDSLVGQNLQKALQTKFNKDKAIYDDEYKSYKMTLIDENAQLAFISFFQKQSITDVLKKLQLDPFFEPTVITKMPKENTQVLWTHALDPDYFEQTMCYTPNGSKELYIENLALSVLKEDNNGTYLYLSYIDAEAFFNERY